MANCFIRKWYLLLCHLLIMNSVIIFSYKIYIQFYTLMSKRSIKLKLQTSRIIVFNKALWNHWHIKLPLSKIKYTFVACETNNCTRSSHYVSKSQQSSSVVVRSIWRTHFMKWTPSNNLSRSNVVGCFVSQIYRQL